MPGEQEETPPPFPSCCSCCPWLPQKQINHTVSDYDSIGSLKFGLAVWRANLQLDISLAADAKELEALLRDGYYDAKELEALLRDGYYDALRRDRVWVGPQ